MKTRLTKKELDLAHDGMCGITLKDGPCSCLVHWVKALQGEADLSRDQLFVMSACVVKECTRCVRGKILHATSGPDGGTVLHSDPCPCCGEARRLLAEKK